MESQPQNPEFRNNPENFHPCKLLRQPYMTVQKLTNTRYQGYKTFFMLNSNEYEISTAHKN